jgi:hypothetical protein
VAARGHLRQALAELLPPGMSEAWLQFKLALRIDLAVEP